MLGIRWYGTVPRGLVNTKGRCSISTKADILQSWIYHQHTKSPCVPSKVNSPESLALLETVEQSNVNSINNPIGKLFAKGKQFVKLYKSGITNVYRNYRTCRELRKKYNFSKLPELTNYIIDSGFAQGVEGNIRKNENGELQPVITAADNHITRAEYMILLRTSKDVKKLPIFAIFFAIFFETTPILLMVFPRIAPSTCMSPSLVAKDIKRTDHKILRMKDVNTISTANLDKKNSRSVYRLSKPELESLASVLLFPTSFMRLEKLLSKRALQSRLKARIDEIQSDDILLSRFGSTRSLDSQELRLACQSRAITVGGKTDEELRSELLIWMSTFAHKNYDAGFFFA